MKGDQDKSNDSNILHGFESQENIEGTTKKKIKKKHCNILQSFLLIIFGDFSCLKFPLVESRSALTWLEQSIYLAQDWFFAFMELGLQVNIAKFPIQTQVHMN